MKYTAPRPFSDPAVAARKLLEITNATEAVQDGRIHIEKINALFLFHEGGSPQYGAEHRPADVMKKSAIFDRRTGGRLDRRPLSLNGIQFAVATYTS